MGEKDRSGALTGLRYLGAGFSFMAICAVGAFLGKWADQKFATAPWLFLTGMLLGVATATWDLIRTASALEAQDREDKK